MDTPNPFRAPGEWLRCALHAHTTNSDGELAPDRLALHFDQAGYDVLFVTDHWVRTVVEQPFRIITIPSIELNATIAGTGSDAHVLALGVSDDPLEPGASFPNLQDTVDWIRGSGGLAFVAHPYWSGLTSGEFRDCVGLSGVEVFNSGCELELGRGLATVHWDEGLEAGERWLGIASDDSHLPGFDSGFSSVWVKAEERSAEAVLRAIEQGLFYSSNGPRIHDVSVDESSVDVACDPAHQISLITFRTFGASVTAGRLGRANSARVTDRAHDGAIRGARLNRWGSWPFGRVEVTDAYGRKAWTNPLWYRS